jgi:hypothetical protein
MHHIRKKREQSRCRAKNKQGQPCGAAATPGGLCFFHSNPDKAAELGRVGGRKNGRVPSTIDAIPAATTATAVRDIVAHLIAEIYANRLHPRIAAGLGSLLNLQLRAIEQTDQEQRIAALEQWCKEEKEKEASRTVDAPVTTPEPTE